MGKRQGTQAHKNKVDPACRSSSLKIKPSAIPTQTRHSRHNNRPHFIWYLVAILSKLGLGLAVNVRTRLGLGEATAGGLLALVVSVALNLAALLESGNNILVLPADLVGQTANGAVLAAGAQTEDAQSLGNDDALLLVVGRGNTLEDLKALHGGGTTGGLVGNHAADSLVEDAGRSAEVEGTTASGVETSHLAEVGVVLDCSSHFMSVS